MPKSDERVRPARRTRPTSFDVAELAGVSQSTVSRALAGDPTISANTRDRVREAASKLNYYIDQNATRLRTGCTNVIAVIVICRPGQLKGDINPFYYSLLGNVCSALARAGYEALTSFQDSPANFYGYYENNRRADGLIVIGTAENVEAWDYYREVAESGARMVCWGAPYPDQNWVRSDNVEGGVLATRHLFERGYRRIVHVGSKTALQRQYADRFEGYSQEMIAHGLEPAIMQIDPQLQRIDQGRKAITEAIERGQAFDAVFCACDQIAIGVMGELQARGIAIPDQVGVVGFDGINSGEHVAPPLTTIEPDLALASDLLVRRLQSLMTGVPNDDWLVPVRLIVRGSASGSGNA